MIDEEYHALSPNSRIVVLRNPVREPGTCAVCSSPGMDERRFIDFGFQLDYYGAVYFCTECIGEIANRLNYIKAEEYGKLKSDHIKLLNEHAELTKNSKEIFDAARRIVSNAHGIESSDDSGCYSDSGEVSDDSPVESNREAASNNHGPDESRGLKGLGDLRATSGDDNSDDDE